MSFKFVVLRVASIAKYRNRVGRTYIRVAFRYQSDLHSGKKMSTVNSNVEELSMNVPTTRAPRNVTFLHKLRKRLGSRDRKFVDTIATQTFLTENSEKSSLMVMPTKNEVQQLNRTVPLPPIRITVTNPLPDDEADQGITKAQNNVEEQNMQSSQNWLEERQKKMPHVRFSLPKKRRHNKKMKKRKRATPIDKTDDTITNVDGDTFDKQTENSNDRNVERRLR